jgi:hypothetical protein
METLGAFRGLEPSGSLPLASPASLPLGLVCNEERKMTAGSGRRLSVLLPQSGPLGRCLKILLESETWASPEYSLRWKLKATKCGCSVFQLAPSARRTDERGIGLSATSWQTVTATMIEGGEDRQEKRMEFRRAMGRNSFAHGNLGEQMGMLSPLESAWPTPTGRDHKGATQNPERMDYVPNILQAGIGPMPSTCLARTEKFAVRLMTLSAWLMGYTAAYLAHWATASSRKSRPKSSQP